MIQRTSVPVIAVFGSTGEADHADLELAEQIGGAIADREWIVLTGGKGSFQDQTIKNRTIYGACNSATPGRWIGVLSKETPEAIHGSNGQSLVIHTDLGDKRNLLEAYLCDVAVALPGGDGTVSEAVCAMALGRPVCFVGSGWLEHEVIKKLNTDGPLNTSEAEDLVKAAHARLDKAPANSQFDELVKKTLTGENLTMASQLCTFLPSGTPAISVVDTLSASVATVSTSRAFDLPACYRQIVIEYMNFVR